MTQEELILQRAEKYRKQCIYLASKICGSVCDGEEIFSDALRVLWEKCRETPPDNLEAYLYRIIRNLSLKQLERQSAQKRSFDRASLDGFCEQADFDSVESHIDAQELTALINGYLKSLKKDARNIFICRCYYQMSTKETAKHLKISESKVKSSLMRSRRELKELIGKAKGE